MDTTRWPHLADTQDIIQWSDRTTAQSEFPGLVRRLIQQTNDQVTSLDMRSEEGVGAPGYDGIVEASRATPFVPLGNSVWELGTGANPQDKANEDYKKRTKDPLGVNPAENTFVFVTPRRWTGKDDWARRRKAEGKWKDVKAFDVDNIMAALEMALAVHFGFSEAVGKPASSVRTIEDWWTRFSGLTVPELTPDLVLCGRLNEAAALLRLLEEDTRFTTIKAKSIDDGLAFVASAILMSSDAIRDELLARTLIVHDHSALRMLDSAIKLLILLPFEEDMRRQAELVRDHHVVFIAVDDTRADIHLPQIDYDEFRDKMVAGGVEEGKAGEMARAATKSLIAYQRLVSGYRLPVSEWATQFASKAIRRAWLAHGWNTSRSGDVETLESLLGEQFGDFEADLLRAASMAEPIFTRVGGTWGVIAPADTWESVRSRLTQADLAALEMTIQTVLGAIDPALDLPAEERWAAAIHGKSRIHSSDLRKGLATTLAFLGANGDTLDLGRGYSGTKWAERVAFELLGRANSDLSGRLWASLSDVLPLIAEAAPDVFLNAVDSALGQEPPLLLGMFADRGEQQHSLSVNSPHTGLLWAVEVVAWSPVHFSLACEQLARLAGIDPGGRLTNRPMNSLAQILSPWLPQTSADLSQRIAFVRAIQARNEEVGWRLLLALLPEAHMIGHPTMAPEFRDWKADVKVTQKDYWDYWVVIAEQMLVSAKSRPERWQELIPRLDDFPPGQREAALSDLASLSMTGTNDDVVTDIWETVQQFLRRHREFPDAKWSLPPEELSQLEEAVHSLTPKAPIQRHKWLFESHMPDLGIRRRGDDLKAYDEALSARRIAGVRDVWEEGALDAIKKLAAEAEVAWAIGSNLAASGLVLDSASIIELLDDSNPRYVEFAKGYVRAASDGSLGWLLSYANKFSGRPLVQARLLGLSTELQGEWAAAKEQGEDVEAAYWREFVGYGRGGGFDLVNEASRGLLNHKRPAAALDLLAMYSYSSDVHLDVQVIIDAFEELLSQGDPDIRVLSSHDIQQLLEFLRKSDVNEETMAGLEWRLLPAAPFEASSPTLERHLSRDPSFFVQILSLLFRPKNREMAEEVPEHLAHNAYRLLDDWKQVPGSDEIGGSAREEDLSVWIEGARVLLAEADRSDIGEVYIGHILAYATVGEDGSWPETSVRNVLENNLNEHLKSGFVTETYNKRGVTSRSVNAGGQQEYELADQFEAWSAVSLDRWPRTAAVLRSIADGYRSEGRMHDEEVRKYKEGLDR